MLLNLGFDIALVATLSMFVFLIKDYTNGKHRLLWHRLTLVLLTFGLLCVSYAVINPIHRANVNSTDSDDRVNAIQSKQETKYEKHVAKKRIIKKIKKMEDHKADKKGKSSNSDDTDENSSHRINVDTLKANRKVMAMTQRGKSVPIKLLASTAVLHTQTGVMRGVHSKHFYWIYSENAFNLQLRPHQHAIIKGTTNGVSSLGKVNVKVTSIKKIGNQ